MTETYAGASLPIHAGMTLDVSAYRGVMPTVLLNLEAGCGTSQTTLHISALTARMLAAELVKAADAAEGKGNA